MGFSWICETGDLNSFEMIFQFGIKESICSSGSCCLPWFLLAGSALGSASAEMDWQLSDVPGTDERRF